MVLSECGLKGAYGLICNKQRAAGIMYIGNHETTTGFCACANNSPETMFAPIPYLIHRYGKEETLNNLRSHKKFFKDAEGCVNRDGYLELLNKRILEAEAFL